MMETTSKNRELFDYTAGYESDKQLLVNTNLSDKIVEAVIRYNKLFNNCVGLAIASGKPGAGKDCLFNYLSWVLYRGLFHKKLLRDEKPRELFGEYDGIFNDKVLKEELDKMKELASEGKTQKERVALLEDLVDEWVSSQGEVILKHVLLYLTELWRYCYKRNPHAPINKTMGGIFKQKRHLDALILGTIQMVSDIDKYTCLPFVDWEIVCTNSAKNRTGFVYYVFPVKHIPGSDKLERTTYPADIIKLDGAEPITDLGEPITLLRKYDLSRTKKENRRDVAKVIDAIKSGITIYEDLLQEVKTNNLSVLKILKGLFLTKPQTVNYGCWFGLYNSKSPARM